jgi:predicted nucleic acid-binding protein
MKLAELNDANIFIFHANDDPTFGDSATAFLNRVEKGEISGVVTPAVVDEVLFKILIGEGARELGKVSFWEIKKHMKDRNFSRKLYSKVTEYWEYVSGLQASGLKVLSLDADILEMSVGVGEKYGLLTTDSLHAATCILNEIPAIATSDADFKRVKGLKVFTP